MSATLSSADAGYMQEAASDHSNSDLLLLPASTNNEGSRGNSPISQLVVRKSVGSSSSLPKSAPTTPNTLTPYSIPSNGTTPETAARWNSNNSSNGSRPHQSTTPENSLLTATSAFPSAPRNTTTTTTTPSSIAAPAISSTSTTTTAAATGNDPSMYRPTFSSSSTRHPQRLATPKIVPAPSISPHITPSKKNFAFNVNAMPFVPLVIVGGGGEEELLLLQEGGGTAAAGVLPGAACHNTSNSSLSHMASSTHSSPSNKHFRNPGTPTSLHPQHQPMMGQSGTRVDSFYPQQKEGEGERYVTEEFYGDDFCDDSYDTDYDYYHRRQECGSETGSISTMGQGGRGSQPRSTVLRDADLDAMDENLRSDEMWDDYSDSSSDASSFDDGLDEGEREWLESMLQPTENPPGIFK